MPTVSRKQQRAMFAAASGHSTLGIPQSVGTEFAKADMERAHGGHFTQADRGKLEKLRGRARTSAEKSGKGHHAGGRKGFSLRD